MTLSNQTIRTAKAGPKVRHLSDGTYGLMLRIQPTGSRAWVQRITVDGKPRMRGLGRWPAVTLENARKLAQANYQAANPPKPTGADAAIAALMASQESLTQAVATMASNIETLTATVAALTAQGAVAVPQAITKANGKLFADVAQEWYQRELPSWREGTAKAVRSLLDRHLLPALANMDIALVDAASVANACKAQWQRPTGSTILMRALQVIGHAKAHGYRSAAIDRADVLALLPVKARHETKHRWQG